MLSALCSALALTLSTANYNHFVQTSCQRPVEPHPLPRASVPKPHAPTVAGQSLIPPPKKQVIVPTVPVLPIPEDQKSIIPKDTDTPWWASTGAGCAKPEPAAPLLDASAAPTRARARPTIPV